MLWGISEMVSVGAFQTFAIGFNTPENLLGGISGALGTKQSYFLSRNVICENAIGIYEMVSVTTFKP